MKAWLIFGSVSGSALGIWLSQTAHGLDLIDGIGLGLGVGIFLSLGLASIPWTAMGRREF